MDPVDAGKSFSELYYKSIDTDRPALLQLYAPQAVFVWNGNPAQGLDALTAFFQELPPTKHTISSLDIHPSAVPGSAALLITTKGSVAYAGNPGKTFMHSFLLTQEGSPSYTIANECFRFV
eukprot:m.114446 g.114446  ORF g.114446 m.114446 type:complete len:121 (-) comp9449_c0_seq1:234-596(-)